MIAILALVVTFLVGLIPTIRGIKWFISFGISSVIMPAIILIDEFVLPYNGGGASFYPLTLYFGGSMGLVVGYLGAVIGDVIKKEKDEKHK